MIKLTKYILLLLLFAVPSQAAIIFHQDWEDGGIGTGDEGFRPVPDQACCSHSITNSTAKARSGSHSIRSLIYRDDPEVSGSRPRAELGIEPINKVINGKRVLPEDTDRWFGFSIYIPSDPDINQEHIFNPHAHNWPLPGCPGGGGAPFALYITGKRWGGTSLTGDSHAWRLTGAPPGVNGADPGKITLMLIGADNDMDKWTDFVFHINLSRKVGGPGLLEIWKNGDLIYKNLDFDISEYPTPQSCGDFYPKTGLSTVETVYHDMIYYLDSQRWGDENSSYAEVDPAQAGSAPAPIEPDPVPGNTIEAETGNLSGTMQIFMDSTTSGGSYTRIDGTGQGAAEFTVNAEQAGLYNIIGKLYAWSEDNDTLYVSVDNGPEEQWKLNVDFQQWTNVTYPRTLQLSQGTHILRFSGEDHSPRLDYFTIENVQEELISPPTGFQLVK